MTMALWCYVLLLAAVQGLTEFLPVSSSGHLAVLAAFFGFRGEESAMLGIMLHAGSLLAIIVFYFRILIGFFRRDQFRLLCMVVLASVPAGIIGLTVKHFRLDETLFQDEAVIAFGFLITGALLLLSGKKKLVERAAEPTPLKEISWKQALTVGCVQAAALIPGISRSGSTISTGLFAGIEREAAATFSFLLALPAIFGATLLETIHLLRAEAADALSVSHLQLGVAVAVSAAVRLFALSALVKVVKKGRLAVFSWYVFALGAILIVKYFARFAA
ncbi:MAG: undecaprenyl-diphosphate phosphatase [Victivallaceae bacterium]|nr:undecaprenyl-diphosphate phosphatase [Victivallaceae bacterium]